MLGAFFGFADNMNPDICKKAPGKSKNHQGLLFIF
jgi:hypothetical protein